MPAPAYGRGLAGLTLNLLVRDVVETLRFQTGVLGVEAVYHDPDFAVVRGYGSEWSCVCMDATRTSRKRRRSASGIA